MPFEAIRDYGQEHLGWDKPKPITYVYEVRSNKPLDLGVGIGNMPSIGYGTFGGLVVRDLIQRAESNGAAASVGHRVSMELVERIEHEQ